MTAARRVYLPVIGLLFLTLACALPAVMVDTGAISTSAALTVVARYTLSAEPAASASLGTPTFTFTPAISTFTPTTTLSATPVLTVTPLYPQISVSVPTNCRSGPGKVYDMEGGLLVGETVQVYARDPTNNYWYIHNPDEPNDFCWVWGEYATLTGNFTLLPVFTPPPTPTVTFTPTVFPEFEISYTGLDSCTGWWMEFKLRNTGSITFRSVGISIRDTVTGTAIPNLTDGFIDINGCSSSTSKDSLLPNKAATISAPAFTYDPTGHKINTLITLCSNVGQNGTCVTRSIEFTP
jgi:hypothetical protein